MARKGHPLRRSEMMEAKDQPACESKVVTSEMVAGLSHALRTPLNGIVGFSAFLASERPGPLNAAQKEFLGDVQKCTADLQRLLNDLTDLAKVEAGQLKLLPAEFPLWTVGAEVESSLRSAADAKGIQIRLEGESEDGQVALDASAIRRVLSVLLSSAIHFATKNGVVTLRIESREEAGAAVTIASPVTATGTDGTVTLLREFQRTNLGASRENPGVRLGLALAKKLVESHGGRLDATQEGEAGMVFTVTLPRTMATS